jgi:hypothetical protein
MKHGTNLAQIQGINMERPRVTLGKWPIYSAICFSRLGNSTVALASDRSSTLPHLHRHNAVSKGRVTHYRLKSLTSLRNLPCVSSQPEAIEDYLSFFGCPLLPVRTEVIAVPDLGKFPDMDYGLDITLGHVVFPTPNVDLLFTLEEKHHTASIDDIIPSVAHRYREVNEILTVYDLTVPNINMDLTIICSKGRGNHNISL